MVLSEEGEEQLNKKHLDLCNKLNLDADTIKVSWENFKTINKNFVLEGDSLHWLGCSIFAASRGVETPTLGLSVVKGNCINLTSLLRHSNLSFAQFFCKINKWAEMAHLPEEFLNKITHLKDTFGVAYSTFKEFYPIFSKIFLPPSPQDLDQSKQHRNRKQRPVPCNTSKVFEFIWNLFITLKGEDSQYCTELIKSFHLLYACIDLAFKNAFFAERRDLLNPQFEGLPSDWTAPSFVMPTEAPCLISYLCKSPSMLTVAMHMKVYELKGMVTNLIKNKTLIADQTNLTGLFNREVFEQNFKNITNTYEALLLNKGDFDERIFLAEYRRQLLEQQSNMTGVRAPFCDPGENRVPESPRNSSGMVTPTGGDTPLTGRTFLGPREADITPLSIDRTTTQKITRLHNMLNNRSPAPSETLVQLFQSCQKDPLAKIQNVIKTLSDKFLCAYLLNNPQSEEEAKNRLQIGITLFYKFIESILQNEKNIRNDISALVEKELFYQSMFTCCLEIVIFSYSSSKKFPWILDALDIEPIHFVKVIELIVRSKDQLSREMIKHLNKIEETVLESLIWKSSSQIWDIIAISGQGMPKFEDTALPGHLLYNEQNSNRRVQNPEVSPTSQSPGPSATDCFQSPVTQNTSVNRQLFPAVQAGHSLLQKQTHLDKDGNRKVIPLIDGDKVSQQPNPTEATPALPKKTGSLSIIFRKFYNLAGVRMEHLCSNLGLTDVELKRKIWTVFEHSVRNTDLIKDRHLDQLLMCAVYVICKVTGSTLKFQDIMKLYREQPQSVSDVYRDVLLIREKVEGDGKIIPATRNDLIFFYNSIYVEAMQNFAVKFRSSVQNSSLLLSPLPLIKRDLVSSSIQVIGNVFVKPLENPSAASGTSFNYFFSRSPSKDLKDINKLVNSNAVTGKRLLVDGDMDYPASKRISDRKFQSLVEERRSQNSE
ncbi:retinoblastoma-like protein 1 isoform X2 [Anoplophora glabripennis]|uniref:retinoblastoma-like protein 1 isoform X2 n=1 Tax=Anoplophora glabripennis TaxID=217634 RepID=UPI0008744BA4|nr:retinoblastoma-like protein 1 isoform X2 [Anoplophora glabripennis]